MSEQRPPLIQPQLPRTFFQKWLRFWLIVLAAGILLSFGSGASKAITIVAAVLLVSGTAFAIVPWVARFVYRLVGRFNGDMDCAMKRIPSPTEISWQLQQEWGRPATVQEVAAVQQILINEKNQAMISAGITLGAVYLMNRNLHHK